MSQKWVYHPFRAHFQCIHTGCPVNGHTIPLSDIPDDGITRNRLTTFPEFEQNIINPLDNHTVLGLLFPHTADDLVEDGVISFSGLGF